MPFRAGAPFLLKVMYLGEANVIMYQCPFGLGSISTQTLILMQLQVRQVSMPSRASAPFLPEEVYEYQIKSGQVSMPFRASVPFLRYVDLVVYS